MVKAFKNSFDSLIDERVMEIDSELLIQNKDFYEIDSKMLNILNQIKENLSIECKNLSSELEMTINCRENIAEKLVYEQGLADGVQLQSILKKI